LATLVLAGILILNNKTLEGLATVITALGGIVGAFVYANERKIRELKEKEEDSNQ
jgi:hypothetical protein